MNARGGKGAEVIYALRNNSTLANKILDNIGNTGQVKRKVYQRRLPSDYSKDYYFIHRNTGNTEPLIIEYGFIDDSSNSKFLNDNYKNLAEAVIKAVLEYKGIPYTPPINNIENTYTVKKGDTLYSISKQLNIPIEELKQLNNLTSNLLTVGQILILPQNNLSNTYTVQKGDTLYSIANKFNITVNDLKQLNNLVSNNLSIGDTLLIPSTTNNNKQYIVKKGDTIYSIAKENNISIEELKQLNNLTNNLLSIGQILLLPTNNIPTIYIVQRGDTLYSIANKFNTTVSKLKELNNLTNDNLSIGEELKIN